MEALGSSGDPVPAFGLAGETPALARALDWAATPLGPVDGWPHGLRVALGPDRVLEPVDLAASLALVAGRSAEQLVSRLAAELPAAERLRDDYAILALSLD